MISPLPEQVISISNQPYFFDIHPFAKNMVFSLIGSKAKIFRVRNDEGGLFALKVFYKSFRTSHIIILNDILKQYVDLPGLTVSNRLVLTKENNADAIREYPDLEFSVLMPWIEGSTCLEIFSFFDNLPLPKAPEIIQNTKRLSEILYGLERYGLAHTDISSSNVIVNTTASKIDFVGIENFYGEKIPQPAYLSAGSPGYAHPTASEGLWCPEADRFAGAILVVEYLGLLDAKIKQYAHGETFFASAELGQRTSGRFNYLKKFLASLDKRLSELFTQTWFSPTLEKCPSLEEWYVVMKDI